MHRETIRGAHHAKQHSLAHSQPITSRTAPGHTLARRITSPARRSGYPTVHEKALKALRWLAAHCAQARGVNGQWLSMCAPVKYDRARERGLGRIGRNCPHEPRRNSYWSEGSLSQCVIRLQSLNSSHNCHPGHSQNPSPRNSVLQAFAQQPEPLSMLQKAAHIEHSAASALRRAPPVLPPPPRRRRHRWRQRAEPLPTAAMAAGRSAPDRDPVAVTFILGAGHTLWEVRAAAVACLLSPAIASSSAALKCLTAALIAPMLRRSPKQRGPTSR